MGRLRPLAVSRQIARERGEGPGMTTHASLTRLALSLCTTTLLVPLAACDGEGPSDASELRGDTLDPDALEVGECVALPDAIESVYASKWTLWPTLASIIVEDNVMYLYIVIENDIMLRVAGPEVGDDQLMVDSAIAIVDDPELANDCGFCDGLCVDGKCLMNLPPFSIGREGLCRE